MSIYLIYLAWSAFVLGSARNRDWSGRAGKIELLALGAASVIIICWLSDGKPLSDFVKAYYPAGRLIWESPELLYSCDQARHPSSLCFVNFPAVAVLFSPLAFLPLGLAKLIFTGAGIVATSYGIWRLADGADTRNGRLVIALCLLSGPLIFSIWLGNITHMLLPLMLIGFEAQSRNKGVVAGLVFALLAFLKPLFSLFILYLVLRQSWRAAAVMALTGIAVFAISLVAFGLPVHVIFVRDYVLGFGARPVVAFTVENYAAAIAHLTMPLNHLKNWMPIEEAFWFKLSRVTLSLATIFGVAAMLRRVGKPQTEQAKLAELCIALCVILLVAPVTWTHYLALLLIPFAWFITNRFDIEIEPVERVAIAAALFFVLLPVHQLAPSGSWQFVRDRLWNLHYVVGIVTLLAILLRARLRMAVVVEVDAARTPTLRPSWEGDEHGWAGELKPSRTS